ncbi:MAG: spore germination protein, partial [Bacillales bacterium]|nr:spore germination protein [Bacillales bacterium]
DLQKGIDAILIGDALVIVDGLNEAIIIAARGYAMRAIAEPTNEQVVRGPRDGFVENLRTNTALLRRRVRDPLFRIDSVQIGKKTKTDVGIAYIKGLASDDLIEEVKARLDKIEIDGILESGYIEELISDGPW